MLTIEVVDAGLAQSVKRHEILKPIVSVWTLLFVGKQKRIAS